MLDSETSVSMVETSVTRESDSEELHAAAWLSFDVSTNVSHCDTSDSCVPH